jgi:hypothetical protein
MTEPIFLIGASILSLCICLVTKKIEKTKAIQKIKEENELILLNY